MFRKISISLFFFLSSAIFVCHAQAQGGQAINRAMWVWNSLGPILEEEERKELLDFCDKHRINELFFQLQYTFSGGASKIRCQIGYEEQLRSFIREAHRKGIKIHALDGNAEFVLRPNHPKVLAQIEAILKFNIDAAPEERYDGIHLDNEPYLLVGFDSPFKEEILRGFLELNQKCMNLIRSSGQEIVYGIDIPFWFEESDERGKIPAAVTFEGVNKAASFHAIDIVDNVGIMDYRNFAKGEDGIIAHGIDEIKYASQVGKKVYIGVETFHPEPEKVIFIYGHPEYEFNRRLQSIGGQFAKRRYYKGSVIRRLDDGKNVHIGFMIPSGSSHNTKIIEDVLLEISKIFGKDVHVLDKEKIREMTFNAEWAISREGPYEGFTVKMMTGDRPNRAYIRFEADMTTLSKITFAGMSKAKLEKTLAEVEDAFKDYPGFYGFAIHYYKSYKAMKDL